MNDFVTLFNQYKSQAGIAGDRGVCSLLSKALEQYKPEQQLALLKTAIDKKLDINAFAVRLSARADVTDLKMFLEAKAKAAAPKEVPAASLPASKPAPASAGEGSVVAGSSAAAKDDESPLVGGSVLQVPAFMAGKSLVPNMSGPGIQLAADDGEAPNKDDLPAEEPIGDQPVPPPGPRQPVVYRAQQVEEKISLLDWVKDFRGSLAKSKKNRETRVSVAKAGQISLGKQSRLSKGKPVNKLVWWFAGAVVLVILFLGLYIRSGNSISDLGTLFVSDESAVPVIPDQNLTAMTPEEKENWANSRLNGSVTETFLSKPASFSDFFANFKSYLNWLLYISAVLLVSFSIFRERTQAAEFSDIRQYMIGISSAFMFITLSNLIGSWAFDAGWTTSPLIFRYVALIVGFLINIFMQYSAYDSGNKDLSVIAAGIYIFGLLLKWWFPADALLSSLGFGLMVLGLVVQYLEIRRHANRDSGAVTKSVVAAIFMLLVFVSVYVGMYRLLETQISAFVIPADAVAQEGAAVRLNLLVKGQIAVAAIVGLAISYLCGLVYGIIFLPTRGRDGTVDIRNALVLDADASTLFVMFLFLFIQWIWILPKFWLMVFG